MKVLILSRNRFLYSTRRLVKACRVRGHSVAVANPLVATVTFGDLPSLTFEGQPVDADVVLPRIGHSITEHGLTVVSQLEAMHLRVINNRAAIHLARDKALALQVLNAAGVPVPPTAMTRNPIDIDHAVEAAGGLPVILKTIRGTQGIGVMLLDSIQSVRSIFDTMRSVNQDVMIQKFYAESAGRDIRVFVVGGKVVAAMRRHSASGDFRANIHRGGKGEALVPDARMEKLAISSARAIGLEIAGVDILETNDGPRVIEVNPFPGLEGIEEASGVDIADHIVDLLEHVTGVTAASPSTTTLGV